MTAKIGSSIPTINATGSVSLLSQEDSLENYKFIDLPASIVQKLTPKVEVYKVYPPKISGSADRAYLLHQGVHRAEDIRRELRQGIIKASDSNRQGVVLQAVDFTRLGGNPAEVQTNIKFNIKLYAKSITEFFTKTDSFPDGTTFTESDFDVEARYEPLAASFDAAERARDTALRASAASTDAVIADLLAAGRNDAALRASDLADSAPLALQEAEAALAGVTPDYRRVRQERLEATDFRETAWIDIIKIDPGQELTADVGNPSAANQPPPASNQLQVVEKDVRIKVKIGYSLPDTKPSDIESEEWTKWGETVEKQKEEFFLSLLKHEWSFLGMQGVELSVDFIATGNAKALQPDKDLLGGVSFSSYDELRNTGFSRQRAEREAHIATINALRRDIERSNRQIEEALLERARIRATVSAQGGNFAAGSGNQSTNTGGTYSDVTLAEERIEEATAAIELCEEKIEAIDAEELVLDAEVNNVRAEFKMRLLRQLYLDYGEGSEPKNRKTRVFRARAASTLSYISNMTFQSPDISRRSDSDEQSGRDVSSVGGGAIIYDTHVVNPLAQGEERRIEALLEGSGDIYTAGDFVFLGDIIEAAYEAINVQSSMEAGDSAEIARLQDAEKAASDAAWQDLADGDFPDLSLLRDAQAALAAAVREAQVPFALVGESDFTEILSRFDTVSAGKVTYPHPINPRTNWRTISISDIPISLDLFRIWWIGEARRMNSYPIRDFIPDLMKFVTDMFKNLKYRQGVRHVEMKDYELPSFILNNVSYSDTWNAMETNREGIYVSLGTDWFQGYLNDAKSNGLGKTTTVIEQADVSDTPRGDVPNIIFGQADKGILKQVSFEREDIPGHAEARLMTDRDSVASNIALREKYNVTLEMRGTTSFLPGSVLYLDITPIELGYTDEDGSYAKQLGLGGMYRIVSVQSSLGLDGKGNSWVTRLKTKWESFGDGTNGDPNAIGNTRSGGDCN